MSHLRHTLLLGLRDHARQTCPSARIKLTGREVYCEWPGPPFVKQWASFSLDAYNNLVAHTNAWQFASHCSLLSEDFLDWFSDVLTRIDKLWVRRTKERAKKEATMRGGIG
jgi:hypothetical protein